MENGFFASLRMTIEEFLPRAGGQRPPLRNGTFTAAPPHPSRLRRATFPSRGRLWRDPVVHTVRRYPTYLTTLIHNLYPGGGTADGKVPSLQAGPVAHTVRRCPAFSPESRTTNH